MSRPRFRLTSFMIFVAFIAIALGLVARVTSAARRERALWQELWQTQEKQYPLECMNLRLSARGIDILKQTTDVELLRVARGPNEIDLETSPTGVMLGEAFALRVACVLLDYRNYRAAFVDPFMSAEPTPLVGLRFHGESSILDVVMEAFSGGGDRGVWFRIHDQTWKTAHSTKWPHHMRAPELRTLAAELLHRDTPR